MSRAASGTGRPAWDLTFFRGSGCCRGHTLGTEARPALVHEWGAGGDVACSPHRQSDMVLGDWCWGQPRLAVVFHQARATRPQHSATAPASSTSKGLRSQGCWSKIRQRPSIGTMHRKLPGSHHTEAGIDAVRDLHCHRIPAGSNRQLGFSNTLAMAPCKSSSVSKAEFFDRRLLLLLQSVCDLHRIPAFDNTFRTGGSGRDKKDRAHLDSCTTGVLAEAHGDRSYPL
ncbi:uncharacterized protein B0H64DRAFT_129623 [Chaetomium fimeti]|uniref:Uncharacterized protein n=1 Tax=Chaetomium fimeti TaxID=1854472 RepID=A0AAE0HK36_9PEZI|nr:hypothetical protein B0H64DRAFT_129623 [Chaetomium fimeti]